MQSDDFTEVPIKRAPEGKAAIGHNEPPPDKQMSPEDAAIGLFRLVYSAMESHPDSLRWALAERLRAENDDLIKRIAVFQDSLGRTPEKLEDEETAKKAADFVGMIAAGEKRVEDRFVTAKAPFLEFGRAVDAYFNSLRRSLAEIKTPLLSRIGRYQDALREAERKRLAAIAEAQRQEAQRKREEAERQRQEAEAAARAGDMAEAIRKADEAAAVEATAKAADDQVRVAEQQAVVLPSSVATVRGSFGGTVSSRTGWDFEVTDISKLPGEYLLPNESLIRAKMNAFKKAKQLVDGVENTTLLAGVRFFQKTGQASRG